MAEEVTVLYRRVAGSTNFRRVGDQSTVASAEWLENGSSGGKNLVWLTAREECFREELAGIEVNEIAGRVIVLEPTDNAQVLSCGCVSIATCPHRGDDTWGLVRS